MLWGWIVAAAFFALSLAFLVLNIWNVSKAREWQRKYEIVSTAYDALSERENTRTRERDEARKQRDNLFERNSALDMRLQMLMQERDTLSLQLAEALSPARTVPLEVVDVIAEAAKVDEAAKPKRTSRKRSNGTGQEQNGQ